jgi:hypothetical protein
VVLAPAFWAKAHPSSRGAAHYDGCLDGQTNQGRFHNWLSLTLAAIPSLIISDNQSVCALVWIATSLCLYQLLMLYAKARGGIGRPQEVIRQPQRRYQPVERGIPDRFHLACRACRCGPGTTASAGAMDDILNHHEPFRQLVENGWLHLFRIRISSTTE